MSLPPDANSISEDTASKIGDRLRWWALAFPIPILVMQGFSYSFYFALQFGLPSPTLTSSVNTLFPALYELYTTHFWPSLFFLLVGTISGAAALWAIHRALHYFKAKQYVKFGLYSMYVLGAIDIYAVIALPLGFISSAIKENDCAEAFRRSKFHESVMCGQILRARPIYLLLRPEVAKVIGSQKTFAYANAHGLLRLVTETDSEVFLVPAQGAPAQYAPRGGIETPTWRIAKSDILLMTLIGGTRYDGKPSPRPPAKSLR